MKVAIITRNANPWVFFVISRLTIRGVEVIVVNESRPSRRPRWMSFKFLRRRGLLTFCDLFLQWLEAGLARAKCSLFARRQASDSDQPAKGFNAARPFEFRTSLAAMAAAGIDGNSLVQWHDVDDVNSPATIQLLRREKVQHILLCGASLVRISLFQELGPLINAHCGISPQYKGSSPIHWAAFNRDWDKIGFTLHIASAEVDGGPMIHQEKHRPRPGWTLTDLDWFLVYSMYDRLCELVVDDSLTGLIAAAIDQQKGFRNYPPMGLIRSRIASQRLDTFLARLG